MMISRRLQWHRRGYVYWLSWRPPFLHRRSTLAEHLPAILEAFRATWHLSGVMRTTATINEPGPDETWITVRGFDDEQT